jgi:hypothetical protein
MKESAVAGLLSTAGSPIPLKGVAIDVSGRGPAARVTVAQNYRNDEGRPVEAVGCSGGGWRTRKKVWRNMTVPWPREPGPFCWTRTGPMSSPPM